MQGRLSVRLLTVAAFAAASALTGTGADAAAVDPRARGFEVAMGEWTVVLEARAIRPGRVTFVVSNRGRFRHGFRIRSDEGGHSGGRFEVRSATIAPGGTARVTANLPAGRYRVECFVEDEHGDHDELGMRALLVVAADAPFAVGGPKRPPAIAIQGFAFRPAAFRVRRGTTVRWVNRDSARHTVSAVNGSFGSRVLGRGASYSRRFARAGTYAYLCAIHPAMRAKVIVR